MSSFADLFRQKLAEVRTLFGEVERLLRLSLVVPASSATAAQFQQLSLVKKISEKYGFAVAVKLHDRAPRPPRGEGQWSGSECYLVRVCSN